MKVFFDTMIYLHYKSLDQLDFAGILGSGPHDVLVPRITLRELDKHKNTHKSSRVQDRARRVLQKLERWAGGEEVRPGVCAEFLPAIPAVEYAKLGLKPEWSDDVLVATVLQYKTDNPTESVALVTQDSGPRLTASHLGISVVELPEEYRLPSEPDPLEVENRELARTIATLQNALPKLNVSFAGSEDPERHARFTIEPPPSSMEEEIARKVEELKSNLPKQHPPKATPPTPNSSLSTLQTQLAGLSYIDPIVPEEYERYNRDVDTYITRYEQYMRDTWELRAAARRTLTFTIRISNVGTAPADDVDIFLHFPDGFRLFQQDHLPDCPDEPRPPRKPRSRMQMIADSIGTIPRMNFAVPCVPDFKMRTSFSIERTRSYDVTDHFSRIKHGAIAILPEMFLTFDSYETASSFRCTYTVRPANLPEPITGELHFVIEKGDANKSVESYNE